MYSFQLPDTNASKYITTKFDKFHNRTLSGPVLASVGYTSHFFARTSARQAISCVFAVIATSRPGTRTLASVGYSSRFLGRTRARQAFLGVFAIISTSRPGHPSDPYFSLRGLCITFPWPNACPLGIFMRYCCNRQLLSRTRTRHF